MSGLKEYGLEKIIYILFEWILYVGISPKKKYYIYIL